MEANQLKIGNHVTVAIRNEAENAVGRVIELEGNYLNFMLNEDNGGLTIDTNNPSFLNWSPIPLNYDHLRPLGFYHYQGNAYILKIGNNQMIAWIANTESITGIDIFVKGVVQERCHFDFFHEIENEINKLKQIAFDENENNDIDGENQHKKLTNETF